jgi:hypothetical protein
LSQHRQDSPLVHLAPGQRVHCLSFARSCMRPSLCPASAAASAAARPLKTSSNPRSGAPAAAACTSLLILFTFPGPPHRHHGSLPSRSRSEPGSGHDPHRQLTPLWPRIGSRPAVRRRRSAQAPPPRTSPAPSPQTSRAILAWPHRVHCARSGSAALLKAPRKEVQDPRSSIVWVVPPAHVAGAFPERLVF